MPTRLKLIAGSMTAAALCAGLWAQAQNQPLAPKPVKPPAASTVKPQTGNTAPKKTEETKPAKPAPGKNEAKPEKSAPVKETAPKVNATTDEAAESPEEKEIRAGAETFTKLYNEHDAAGLAALFAEKAEMVDEDGKLVKGREAIEAEFKQQFEDEPECTMSVDIDSVRVLTPHLALEEGVARCASKPGEPEEITQYVCVHVKLDDKWVLASVSDTAAQPENLTAHEHLQDLGWMLGEWIDESPDSNVHSVCDWHESGNFLMYHFQVQFAGQDAMTGTTRIAWDPVAKQFRSWMFDSEGGFTEGAWIREGDEWIVKTNGVTADGEICSSTNVYRQVNNDTLTFRSHDRIVDGQLAPEIAEVVIKRRAPAPEE